MNVPDTGAQYVDLHGLSELKAQASRQPDDLETLRKVASQFEGMFTQMLLKAQRDASFGDPLFDSSAMSFYRDLHDKQMSLHMAEHGGIGLADMLVAQLSQARGLESAGGGRELAGYFSAASVDRAEPAAAAAPSVQHKSWHSGEEFVEQLMPHARRAAEQLGVDPRLIAAQAALETGWGEQLPSDGRGTSFNVFGIKAQPGWSGERTWSSTLEYRDGSFERSREPFRRYESLGDSVDDYVDFLRANPRYQQALDSAGDGAAAFARELGRAGYATDPDYADKVLGVMGSERLRGSQE